MKIELSTPIENIPRVGPIFVKKLQKIGIKTVEDLIFHFPHRYEDFSNIKPISKATLNKNCSILGKILEIKNSRTWKKKITITKAIIEDKTGAIEAVWFNQPYLLKSLKQGDVVCLAGKISIGADGMFLSNPAYEKIPQKNYQPERKFNGSEKNEEDISLIHTARIVPVYPETEGLSSRWLRYILKPLLLELKNKIPEVLPEEIVKGYSLLPIEKAIWQIHFPNSIKLAKKAKERFSFQELFLIELSVLRERLKLDKEKAVSVPININLIKRFVGSLPFRLTDAQRKCAWQILKDLEKQRPMSRLLQGDVGSGKTIVAIIASLNVVKAGYQVSFMAPTEILAKQHFQEVSKLLSPFKIKIALLTGKEDKIISQKLKNELIEISRNKLLEKAKKGEIDILIGTHSLIQEKVKFAKLALCIVDEQHRFGVEQRAKLSQNKKAKTLKQTNKKHSLIPHFLSMTATPIPRTLALTVYGDLDLSILDEMPKGRKKVITKIVSPKEREKTYNFIRERIKEKEQAFVICPRIEATNNENKALNKKENSSWAQVKAVKEEYEKLSKKIFPKLRVEMMHGKMKTKEKEKIMKKFKKGEIDILVSTSVVEVGIDIPKATIMVIEGAERFGLAQLHQFRGRVGRSDMQSYCFLLCQSLTKKTKQRLAAMLKAKSGFELAEKDLEIRGPGSFYGLKQWGIPDLAMENLKNLPLVEQTRQAAKKILEEDPNLKASPILKDKVKKIGEKIHLE